MHLEEILGSLELALRNIKIMLSHDASHEHRSHEHHMTVEIMRFHNING